MEELVSGELVYVYLSGRRPFKAEIVDKYISPNNEFSLSVYWVKRMGDKMKVLQDRGCIFKITDKEELKSMMTNMQDDIDYLQKYVNNFIKTEELF